MEGLNGSNDYRYLNESQLDEAHNVSRSTYIDHNKWIASALSFYILGLLGNLITSLVISCRKDMHTPTFLAICSLAVTDFIVIAISVIIGLASKFDFFRTNIKFWTTLILYAAMIKSSADVVFLFFMRFALIAYPLKCREYLTNSLVISSSLVLWAYSLMFISLKYFIEYLILDLRVWDPFISFWVSTATLMLIMSVLPIAVMFVLHCVKMKKLRSTTVNKAITRKMSAVIISIAVLKIFFGILFFLMTSSDVFSAVVHSLDPFIFFLFHVPYQKCLSLCKKGSH